MKLLKKLFVLVFFLLIGGSDATQSFVQGSSTITYYVSTSGNDAHDGSENRPFKTIQKAVDKALLNNTVSLAPGEYFQDVISKRNGAKDAPITIIGPSSAVIKGGGKDRIIEINHSYIVLKGFTVDGLHGLANSPSGYRDKLIFVLGKEQRKGVTGLTIANMTIKNSGGECIRLRYFAQKNEILNNIIQNCGAYDFVFKKGGKNGEAIYIGTAPEQRKDGKNPTRDIDRSNENWIHHNTFNTQGNECVDIKEGAEGNIIEYNECTGQKDLESAGFDSRGNNNVFRYNKSFGNVGAGIRLGGDSKKDGINNDVYKNEIFQNKSGGIKIQRIPQGNICENIMGENKKGDAVGSYRLQFNPQSACGSSLQTSVSF